MELQTVFVPKTNGMRNNLKSYMIQDFLHYLETSIQIKDNIIKPPDVVIKGKSPPKYLDYKRECRSDECPCLNLNCKLIDYMSIFFSGTEFWLLPAYNKKSHCIICDMSERGTLNISKIRITKNRFVKLI
jgi:hypothetical protein